MNPVPMLLLTTQALALDIAVRVEQPDRSPQRFVLCDIPDDGSGSARIEVPARGLLAWQFRVSARPHEEAGQLLVSVPFAVVDLRAGPSGSDSELHTITPAAAPAFPLHVGESGTLTYPVLIEGTPQPRIAVPGQKEAIVPRFTVTVSWLPPGSAGCAS